MSTAVYNSIKKRLFETTWYALVLLLVVLVQACIDVAPPAAQAFPLDDTPAVQTQQVADASVSESQTPDSQVPDASVPLPVDAEAMTVVQRCPSDYDGVAAMVPVVEFSTLALSPTLNLIQQRAADA